MLLVMVEHLTDHALALWAIPAEVLFVLDDVWSRQTNMPMLDYCVNDVGLFKLLKIKCYLVCFYKCEDQIKYMVAV